jgi:hypothetical protein
MIIEKQWKLKDIKIMNKREKNKIIGFSPLEALEK